MYKDILEYVGPEAARVNDMISSLLRSEIDLLTRANESVLGGGGKHIRPIMALLVAKACSGGFVTEDTIRFATASELLHNATLLHDDVADNSPVRRGRPTVMNLMGSRASVLLGDFWLVRALDRILQSRSNTDTVLRLFSKTLSDLAEGEMFQLQKASQGDTTEQDYLRIIYSKTASLFETAALSAAISVGASPERKKAIRSYAVNVGNAFQVKDDIMDYIGGEATGKPAGQDLLEGKITLPLLGAFKACPEREAKVRSSVGQITEHPELRAEVVDFAKDNGGFDYAERRLGEYVDMAVIALKTLPAGPARDYLADLARFTAERKV
jgi:octaprenyl-diphosphate synthase